MLIHAICCHVCYLQTTIQLPKLFLPEGRTWNTIQNFRKRGKGWGTSRVSENEGQPSFCLARMASGRTFWRCNENCSVSYPSLKPVWVAGALHCDHDEKMENPFGCEVGHWHALCPTWLDHVQYCLQNTMNFWLRSSTCTVGLKKQQTKLCWGLKI